MRYYQERDRGIIDYELLDVDGINLALRGPAFPNGTGERLISFLGAAQTFGVFVPRPFPTIVGNALGVRWKNLGIGGAGPDLFLPGSQYHAAAADADLIVLQVLSGRSADNSRFKSLGFSTLTDLKTGEPGQAASQYERIIEDEGLEVAKQLLDESRETWRRSMSEVLDSFRVPTVLLWFSQRSEEPPPPPRPDVWSLFGGFPQGIRQSDIDEVASHATRYVRCVSSNGLPQRLLDMRTGQPISPSYPKGDEPKDPYVNSYYPSPQMHVEAASALLPVCAELLELTEPGEGLQ